MTEAHTCRIDGCQRQYYCAGLCTTHYQRLKRTDSDSLQPDVRYYAARTMLKDRPMSVAQLADALGISKPTTQKLVRELGASVLFDVSEAGKNGTPAPFYSTLRSDAAHALSLIHKHMAARDDLSSDELALLTGINADSTRKYINYLHNANLAYIGRWTKSKQQNERLWRFGPGEDAPVPAPFTRKEIARRQAQRWKDDPDAMDARRSVMKRHYLRHKAKPKRDALVSALFGKAA